MAITKNFKDNYAYDLDKNMLSKGEIKDDKAINQSIELLITTIFGERLFNPYIGSELTSYLFSPINSGAGEQILNSIIKTVQKYEKRVQLIQSQIKLNIDEDNNSMVLFLPYVIIKNNIVSVFEKKILL